MTEEHLQLAEIFALCTGENQVEAACGGAVRTDHEAIELGLRAKQVTGRAIESTHQVKRHLPNASNFDRSDSASCTHSHGEIVAGLRLIE